MAQMATSAKLLMATITTLSIGYLILFFHYVYLSSQRASMSSTEGMLGTLGWLAWQYLPFSSLFVQEYVYELARNDRWEQVVVVSERKLEGDDGLVLFSVRYHLALGYCLLERFGDCKRAIKQAYLYADLQKLPYFRNVYNILISNGHATQKDIPTGIQFKGQPQQSTSQKIEEPEHNNNYNQQQYKNNWDIGNINEVGLGQI